MVEVEPSDPSKLKILMAVPSGVSETATHSNVQRPTSKRAPAGLHGVIQTQSQHRARGTTTAAYVCDLSLGHTHGVEILEI
jgi:hypothetical protein